MGKIQALSEDIIGKIAAGEVVERPAAAVKELVENSLDAGATAVTVEIREGGTSYIRVADNGCGIEETDIRMAFERHATSKISKEQDLNSIATLGFRGEALASIAAVSKVIMTTRSASYDTGLKVKNAGGQITEISETACPVGTTIVVSDLFFNVPVRRGFMKKPAQEAGIIHELMIQLMLSRPDVSFRYISNGKTEFHSPGDGQTATALQTVYGARAFNSMKPVDDHGNGLVIKGFIGIGENARGNRSQEFFFINGRIMHSKILNEAVETGCRERVMIGKFPICAIYITIAYDAVDVNIHPNKLEVRFRDENGVYEAVLSAVIDALKEDNAFQKPVEMTLGKNENPDKPTPNIPARQSPPMSDAIVSVSRKLPPDAVTPIPTRISGMEFKEVTKTSVPSKINEVQVPVHTPKICEKAEQISTILQSAKKPMKVFGALFNTYILVEYEDQLLLVDQHAVHERLLFDRLMKEHEKQLCAAQELLVPIVMSVTGTEQRLLEDNRELLESIGMIVESFGERDIAVRAIPIILGTPQTRSFLRDVISELETGRDPVFEKKRTALLQTACKHAVKGGEPLTEDQLRDLLDQMIEQKITPTCPHGRPLVVSVSHRELDRKFKRIQK